MKRYRLIPINVDPEVKEFALLNSKVEDNLRQSRAEAATLYAILCLQDRVRLAKAKERYKKRAARKQAALLSKFRYQVVFCLLLFLWVHSLWYAGILSLTVLYCVGMSLTGVVAFLAGRIWGKPGFRGGYRGKY